MTLLLIFAAVLLGAGLLSSRYRRSWSRQFALRMQFEHSGVYEGEGGELTETFLNKKLLPVWWGELKYLAPRELDFGGEQPGENDDYRRDAISVWSYERVKRAFPFTAGKRGYYTIRSADFLTYDMFFHIKLIKSYPQFTELYVFPRRRGLQKYGVQFNKIIGEAVRRRHIVEDPFQFRGVRDYFPFDSIRAVNWNATAKTGELKVNQFEYASSQEVILLLCFDGYNSWDRQSVKEEVIRVGAALAAKLLRNGISVGLRANARRTGDGAAVQVPCRTGSGHNLRLLREMAKIDTGHVTGPCAGLLGGLGEGGGPGRQVILVSYYWGEDLQQAFDRLRAGGTFAQWLWLREKERKVSPGQRPGLTVCEVDI